MTGIEPDEFARQTGIWHLWQHRWKRVYDNPEPPDCRQKNSGDMISAQTGNLDREIIEERQPGLQPDVRTDS